MDINDEVINFSEGTSLEEFINRVDWKAVVIRDRLSEEFIEEFGEYLDWFYISRYQRLSEGFIFRFRDKVDWGNISIYQTLTEAFIKKFQDRVVWKFISKYQKLSMEFIERFIDVLDFDSIILYQKLSRSFIKKHNLVIKDNWNYLTICEKEKFIIENTNYKILKDEFGKYIIAYKGIRSDRYSLHNFQYQYLSGEVYSAHCDYTDEDNSFGLNAWTYEQAKSYCSQLVIKLKIYIKDIGRVIKENNKIRCCKFEVL